jgi:hypothetical protein
MHQQREMDFNRSDDVIVEKFKHRSSKLRESPMRKHNNKNVESKQRGILSKLTAGYDNDNMG